jgi:excisionase family DNA binding protein
VPPYNARPFSFSHLQPALQSNSGPTPALDVIQRGLVRREERNQTMPEKLLTTEQVARYLKIDKFTVYRLVTQKKIPAFKVGNQWRFSRKMIDKWLLENSNLEVNDSKQG